MLSQMTWTRKRFRLVSRHFEPTTPLYIYFPPELEALSDMDENELSYLDDIKAQPDFLDEAPHVPSNEVSFHHISSPSRTTIP